MFRFFHEELIVESIKERWQRLRERVAQAAAHAGRDPNEIQIMAVSKTMPLERILEARDAGVTLFGENRIQEAMQKFGDQRQNCYGN